ncbi:MAG: hypothetical protein ABSD13_05815 [Candidatus Korobacteraceae bacterium]|jgi:cyanophycin synthetase
MPTLGSRIPTNIRKAVRLARRFIDQRSSGSSLDLGALERNQIHEILRDIAEDLGFATEEICNILFIRNSRGKTFRAHGLWMPLDDFATGAICGDKELCRQILSKENVSLPRGKTFSSLELDSALAFARSLNTHCVTKPARGTSSGRGVSVGLVGDVAVRRGFRRAALYGQDILIEEFVSGENFRFLVYQGKCLSVVHRRIATAVGDGVKSVLELVAVMNRGRINSEHWRIGDPTALPVPLGAGLRSALAPQGLSPKSVPAAGQMVRLATHANYQFGATYTEVMDIAHPVLVTAAETAARSVGVRFAGVDVIAKDVSVNEYWINEINTTPSPELHHMVSNSEKAREPLRTVLLDILGSE